MIFEVDVTETQIPVPVTPGCSTVWVEVRPSLRRIHVLAGDILAALGKDRGLSGKGRNQSEDCHLAVAWLRATRATSLVVVNAHRLHVLIARSLMQLAAEACVDLWLLHGTPRSDAFVRLLRYRGAVTRLLSEVPGPGGGDEAVETPSAGDGKRDRTAIPDEDFTTFRWACTTQLSEPGRTSALSMYDTHRLDAAQRFQSQAGVEGVADGLFEALNAATDDSTTVIAVRALQAAAWENRLFVRVDITRLLASEERPRLPRDARDVAMARYRQPHRAIVVALYGAGCGLTAITDVPLSAVSTDGRTITCDGRLIAVTPPRGSRPARPDLAPSSAGRKSERPATVPQHQGSR